MAIFSKHQRPQTAKKGNKITVNEDNPQKCIECATKRFISKYLGKMGVFG